METIIHNHGDSFFAGLGRALAKAPASEGLTRSFQPVKDLKAGDRLRYRGSGPYGFLKANQEVHVYSTDVPVNGMPRLRGDVVRNDFTVIFVGEEGGIFEFAMDSRHFERA